jgi:hypothetical protein
MIDPLRQTEGVLAPPNLLAGSAQAEVLAERKIERYAALI